MARAIPSKPTFTILQLIDRILETNQISRQEHLQITNAMLSGKNVNDEDRRQINRIFESIQNNRITIIS